MTDLCFVDTNIVLYSIGKDSGKKVAARSILALRPIISAQVVNEAVNVCLRRFAFTPKQAYAFADVLMRRTDVRPLDEATTPQPISTPMICGLMKSLQVMVNPTTEPLPRWTSGMTAIRVSAKQGIFSIL